MKLLAIFLTLFLLSNGLQANNQTDEKLTAFCIMSKSGNRLGKGQQKIYFLKDGEFNVFKDTYNHQIRFTFHSLIQNECWKVIFEGPEAEELRLGIYKNAKRCFFSGISPGLEVSNNDSPSSRVFGEFEILEIEYDAQKNIKAFAANFVQRCTENGSPLFASIRVNSSIPIEALFKDRFGKFFESTLNSSAIYVSKRDFSTGGLSAPILLTDEGKKVEILSLPFGGEGVQVSVEGQSERWVFDFAAPIGREFVQGKYETSYRYPFNGCFGAGVGVSLSRSSAARPVGFFEVLDVKKNPTGQIYELSMDFSIETELGEVYTGTIRQVSSKLAESGLRSDSTEEIFNTFLNDGDVDEDEE